ncbi:MAG TPA: GWxTD domain-containing protein [Terriglobales bacterium]|nr:GWxTD domain-containing protein [Terriglobales bacterium]
MSYRGYANKLDSKRLMGWVLLISLTLTGTALGARSPKLAAHYSNWLNRDVVYIISKEERESFLQLSSDAARDQFIEHFWEIRNPTPGAPTNPYREEHYRRLEYANQYFGQFTHTEGWRTDMGRIYITLGSPQQRDRRLGLQKVRPMEVWFYSNSSAALPPFFYVVFYQREATDDFRLYSPYSDGPEKLIQAIVGPTRQQALQTIEQDGGRELARVSMSLLPDEPVDWEGGAISLQSDVMLATIRNLANNPFTKEEIANRRVLEEVTHRIIVGQEYLDVLTETLHDIEGKPNLHYVLRLKRPDDLSLAKSDAGYYFNLGVSIKVFSPGNKLIFNKDAKLSHTLTEEQLDKVKSSVFGYEGWLPLAPGKYKLEFQITDNLKHAGFRSEKEVTIPQVAPGGLYVTSPVIFSEAEMLPPEKAAVAPFSGGGVKFIPSVGQELDFPQGREIKFFYQLWAPGGSSSAGRKFAAEYTYGRLGARDSKTLSEEFTAEQCDTGGSLISGKKISTEQLAPGNYRLLVTVREEGTGKKAFSSLNFRVVPAATTYEAWDLTDEQVADDLHSGYLDYRRGLSWLAQGDKDQALRYIRSAFDRTPGDESIYRSLVDLYFAGQAFSEITDVASRHTLVGSTDTDEVTVLRVAESLEKTGKLQKAVQLLESAVKTKDGSGALYLALAGCYERMGEHEKAAQAESRGKSLMSPTS